ncbi:MAG TPA: ABC transporter permease [Chitinophagaceae bacterium]|jgi:phospholipid/cholesterol/gamma-HCH transport system permease protein|nr:ABC transporter permease [Chitinophagaceae bacterium]
MDAASNQAPKYFISKGIDRFFTGIHDVSKFILQFFKEAFIPPYEFQEVIKQCYQVGYKSLSLITLTAFITGMVFTDHSRPALADFGATSWLPSLTGIAIVKALAPLITSLICAGKIGSQIGAELGSMKVTEQIDAMEVSAVNPFKFLVVTRVLATTFMVPLLTIYSAFIGLMGSFIDVHAKDQTGFTLFIHDAFFKIGYAELTSSLLRSVVFGFTIGIIGCYKGFTTTQGTEGVGRAANLSVVIIMFLIFIEEITIVKFFNPLYFQK